MRGHIYRDFIVISEENDNCNITIYCQCGCEFYSGAGSHGTAGSAWAHNSCEYHQPSLSIDDHKTLRRRIEEHLRKNASSDLLISIAEKFGLLNK